MGVCARERAAARPSTPTTTQARHWSCGPASFSEYCNRPWPLNPQKAKNTTQTKAAKASNSYNSRPCGVRQLHNCNPPRPGSRFVHLDPTSALCRSSSPVQPLLLRVSAYPDGSDSRCLAPFCRRIWKPTHLLPRQQLANRQPRAQSSIVIHTLHPCRATTHCRSGTWFLSTVVF
jgi:hypothetical protein